ncbi:hypothetical protein SAMN05216277_1108 [Halolamina pelagica]|uniref:Uncharacterized protein n=1 Tax=Halolamina pelagica TaxID=699431 RepID=A0A1I5TLN9_9EURY|nr:hypothetical protein SAMN05216277_1108 [Halolamina pelagica]
MCNTFGGDGGAGGGRTDAVATSSEGADDADE